MLFVLSCDVIANAIYSLLECEQWVSEERAAVVSHQAIIQRAVYLAQLLKYEYVLKPVSSRS